VNSYLSGIKLVIYAKFSLSSAKYDSKVGSAPPTRGAGRGGAGALGAGAGPDTRTTMSTKAWKMASLSESFTSLPLAEANKK
jgi:hypothetical protein